MREKAGSRVFFLLNHQAIAVRLTFYKPMHDFLTERTINGNYDLPPHGILVLDESLVEADPAGAEVLWQQAGLAVPIQVNLGISGCNRVLREVRAALQRRERELSLAMRAAAQIMEGEMNTTLTGLLLQTQLALEEPTLAPGTVVKLRQVVELAGVLREQLRTPPVVLS